MVPHILVITPRLLLLLSLWPLIIRKKFQDLVSLMNLFDFMN